MTMNPAPFTPARAPGVLSGREAQLLSCLASGLTIAEIAVTWGVTTGTLATHMRSVFGKLSARTRNHALAISIRNASI
jgi:DNA-binding CsgD family transcriptional regulator